MSLKIMSGDFKKRYDLLNLRTISFMFFLLLAVSCKDNSVKKNDDNRLGKSQMEDLNRYFIQKDKERIQNYIERKDLNMEESPTGLWYQVFNEGVGAKFTDSDRVIFEYECSLLDGTECYSSEDLGPKTLILGKSEMEQGLNEGLRMLSPGAEAIFIIPPFLAYGLIGDGKKIPPQSVIIYYIKIVSKQ